MSVKGFLGVFAPHYVREIEPERLNNVISVAEQYRPQCLDKDKQEIAAAYYAAYLLASGQEAEQNPLGITSEREGDLSRSYALDQTNAAKFYAKWQELHQICVRFGQGGAMTVGLNDDGV